MPLFYAPRKSSSLGHPEGSFVRRIPRSGVTESSPPTENV